MDFPLVAQIAGVIGAAGAGAASERVIKAIRGGSKENAVLASPVAQGLEDSIADVNARITAGFATLKRLMDEGFSRLDNALANHRDEFADLARRVARVERTVDGQIREMEDQEGRLKIIEEWRRAPNK